MKKLILVLLFTPLVLFAAKPSAALVAEIWYLANGTITADSEPDGSGPLLNLKHSGVDKFKIGPEGGIGIGGAAVDYWFGPLRRVVASLINQETDAETFTGFHAEIFNETSGLDNSAYMTTDAQGAYSGLWYSSLGNAVVANVGATQSQLAVWFGGTQIISLSEIGVKAGGTQAWKLGSVIPATVQLVTDRYVQVEIGGQIVKLAVVE